MPWELRVLKYDGPTPRHRADIDESRELPLGTLEEVRQHISAVLPGTEWNEEPALIEMMKANGSELWKTWDSEMIARCSTPTLRALFEKGDLFFEMFGFEQPEPLKFLCLDVRASGDPIPILNALCQPRGWSVVESSRDGEILDLSGGGRRRWDDWQSYLKRAIGLARRSAPTTDH